MPIAKFLTYLQESNKNMTISTGGVVLKNVHISFYRMDSDNSLLIWTEENHEIYLELDNFKEIAFDAIVSRAPTKKTIEYCLSHLEEEKRFHAYFFDDNEKPIVSFHSITDNQKQETNVQSAELYTIDELRMVKDIKNKFEEIFGGNESFHAYKEQNNRFIHFDSRFKKLISLANKLRNISDPRMRMGNNDIDWIEVIKDKENPRSYYFEIQITDEACVYVLLGKVEKIKITWQDDMYDKERLFLIAGLYGNFNEEPRILRDISEKKLMELESLIKIELLEMILE